MYTRGIQLELELLLLISNTLYAQCRHIEHLHKEVRCLKVFLTKWQLLNILMNFFLFATHMVLECLYSACIGDSSRVNDFTGGI